MVLTKKFFPPARSNKEPNIEIKRNVLGQLVSYSLKSDCKIDFEEAWKYLLAKISLSLCHTDWKKRSSLKSDLLKALDIQYSPADAVQDYQQCSFVLNVMAAIVTVGNFTTIEELTWKIVNTISMGCKRVDLVVAVIERHLGKTQCVKKEVLEKKSWPNLLKVRSETGKPLWCSNNTNQMINILFRSIQTAKLKILNKVRTTIMYLSQENQCCSVTLWSQNERVEKWFPVIKRQTTNYWL